MGQLQCPKRQGRRRTVFPPHAPDATPSVPHYVSKYECGLSHFLGSLLAKPKTGLRTFCCSGCRSRPGIDVVTELLAQAPNHGCPALVQLHPVLLKASRNRSGAAPRTALTGLPCKFPLLITPPSRTWQTKQDLFLHSRGQYTRS